MKTEMKAILGIVALAVIVIVAFLVFAPSAPTADQAARGTSEPTGRRSAVPDLVIEPVIPPPQPPTAVTPTLPDASPVARADAPAIAVGPSTQPAVTEGTGGVTVALPPTTQPTVGSATPTNVPSEPVRPAVVEEPANWRVLLAGGTAPGAGAGVSAPSQPPLRPGSVGALTGAPSGVATTPRGETATYTVRQGDTLSSISNALFGSPNYWSKIAQANPGVNSNRLRVGQVLVIPPESEVRGSGVTRSQSPSGSALVKDPTREYQVVAGDSLSLISQRLYGTANRWREIYELNQDAIGPSPTRLRVGMVLKLPAPPTTTR